MHARQIETNDKPSAQAALDKIRKDKLTATDANWNDLAKTTSVDPNSKDAGGDMGWIAEGSNDAGLEIWLFDPARKVGDLSAPIGSAGGTYSVIQFLGAEQKPVDDSQLQGLKDNALNHWLSGQRVAPFNKISTPDSDAMQASRNLPRTPDLNAQLPDFTSSGSDSRQPIGGDDNLREYWERGISLRSRSHFWAPAAFALNINCDQCQRNADEMPIIQAE